MAVRKIDEYPVESVQAGDKVLGVRENGGVDTFLFDVGDAISNAQTKLDTIETGAEVNVGTNLAEGGSGNSRTITSSTGSDVTISTATTSNAGYMSTDDKAKLNGIDENANNYTLPAPTTTTLGGVKRNAGASGTFVAGISETGDLEYAAPSGAGDVVGPGSSVDDEIALFNGTSGTILKNGPLLSIVDPRGSGTNAVAIGTSATASALASTAIGYLANAIGANSTALGRTANASNANSIALGYFATASGSASTALGTFSAAPGTGSTALGRYAAAIGADSTAIGAFANTSALASTAIALGYLAKASGPAATALGASAEASGDSSTAFGASANASGTFSTALGTFSTASNANSIAFGYSTFATGESATALGTFATGSGAKSTALGDNARALGLNSTGLGHGTNASGESSVSAGFAARSANVGCASFGAGANAHASLSTSIGSSSVASGLWSTSLGHNAQASGSNSTALGTGASIATGNYIQIGRSTDTVRAAGTVVSSDARDKTDIIENDLGLEFLSKIKTKKFKINHRDRYYKEEEIVGEDGEVSTRRVFDEKGHPVVDEEAWTAASKKGERWHRGVIAQELMEDVDSMEFAAVKHTRVKDPDSPDEYSVEYGEFIPVLIKAVQELKTRVEVLEND